MDEKELKEALLQKALRYLAIRPRSEKELRIYLLKKTKQDDKLTNQLLNQLKEERLVDDDQFIAWWVEQRSYFRPKGKRALTVELRQRGVSPKQIESYFENNAPDEVLLARQALVSRAKRFSLLEQAEKYQKSIKFLLSRGFSWEAAKKAFEQSEEMK